MQTPRSSVRFIRSSMCVLRLILARSPCGLESGYDYHWGLSGPSNEHLCLPKTLQSKYCVDKLKGVIQLILYADAVPAKYEPYARLVEPAIFDTQQARLYSR
jgi:hypothetical protein